MINILSQIAWICEKKIPHRWIETATIIVYFWLRWTGGHSVWYMNYCILSLILNSLYKVLSVKYLSLSVSFGKRPRSASIIDVLLNKFLIKREREKPASMPCFAIHPHKTPFTHIKTIYWISCYYTSRTHIVSNSFFLSVCVCDYSFENL